MKKKERIRAPERTSEDQGTLVVARPDDQDRNQASGGASSYDRRTSRERMTGKAGVTGVVELGENGKIKLMIKFKLPLMIKFKEVKRCLE
jgi:hypothetical protein